jgi:hypothetical protein
MRESLTVLFMMLGVTIARSCGIKTMTRHFFSARARPQPRHGKAAPLERLKTCPRQITPGIVCREAAGPTRGGSPDYVHDDNGR